MPIEGAFDPPKSTYNLTPKMYKIKFWRGFITPFVVSSIAIFVSFGVKSHRDSQRIYDSLPPVWKDAAYLAKDPQRNDNWQLGTFLESKDADLKQYPLTPEQQQYISEQSNYQKDAWRLLYYYTRR
jgi:hypothetical protein